MVESTDDSKTTAVKAPSYRVKHEYLAAWSFTLMLASTCQGGWVCAENGQVGLVLEQKLGWHSSKDQFVSVNTLATVLGSAGLAFGSQLAGNLLAKFDKKSILLYSNVIQLVIVAPLKMVCSTPTILMGRFLFGLVNACSNLAFSESLNQTVPSE